MTVLTLPTSSRAAALGGETVTAQDDQPGIGLHNPALLAGVDSCLVELQFMAYADGTQWMGAEFSRAFGDRHTGAVYAHYLGYGSMDETDAMGNTIGTFSPKDMVFGVGYSYLLSDRWAGGANFKTAYSRIAEYSSLALAVDLGLNYLDTERDLSLSVAMRNIGAQVKTFDGVVERVPFNLMAGFTKGLAHLPVKFHVTLTDLTHWSRNDFYTQEDKELAITQLLLNHVVFGLEVQPTHYTYIAAGYNFRRAYELRAADGSHGAGLSAGAGLSLRHFKLGLSWARYHKSTNTLMANVAYSF